MNTRIAGLVATGLMLLSAGVHATPAQAWELPPGAADTAANISGQLGRNAPAGTAVSQGDRIQTIRGIFYDECTLGYVNRRAGVAYTAAHCGLAGEPVYNEREQIIGFYEDSHLILRHLNVLLSNIAIFNPAVMPMVGSGPLADVARIRLVPGVVGGANTFSRDRIAPLHEVRPGDKVCAAGATTRHVYCGRVDRVNGDTTYAVMSGLRPGDSGGPAWAPGKGFIGVNSAVAKNMAGTKGTRIAFAHPRAL